MLSALKGAAFFSFYNIIVYNKKIKIII